LGFSEKSFKGSIASRSIASRTMPAAFNCLRRSIACGVQLLAAFNSFAFKGLIACGVQ
jgi:hypothetical protein